jgi:hypothetical protein
MHRRTCSRAMGPDPCRSSCRHVALRNEPEPLSSSPVQNRTWAADAGTRRSWAFSNGNLHKRTRDGISSAAKCPVSPSPRARSIQHGHGWTERPCLLPNGDLHERTRAAGSVRRDETNPSRALAAVLPSRPRHAHNRRRCRSAMLVGCHAFCTTEAAEDRCGPGADASH